MPGALFLEGEQINLRTLEEEDIEFLQKNINNPDIRKNLTTRRPTNLQQQQEFFQETVSSSEDVHLAICNEEEIVGIISLEEDQREVRTASIGLWIDPEHHRNGYGTEAVKLITDYGFNELGYYRIYARAYEENKGSQRIWEKLGYTKEGELRDQAYFDGEFGDIYMYGILEDEW